MRELSVEYKKSSLVASTNFDIQVLQHSEELLLPLSIQREVDTFLFVYDVGDTECLAERKKLTMEEKYRFLLNALAFYEIYDKYEIDLQLDNIYVNYNLDVKLAFRDIKRKDSKKDEESFVKVYLSLLGTILNSKYTFEDFRDCGNSLLKKSKETNEFSNCVTIEDIYILLLNKFQELYNTNRDLMIPISKKRVKALSIAWKILLVAVILLGGSLGIYKFKTEPANKSILNSYKAFVKVDYVETISALKNVKVSDLDSTTKYILAQAYIKSDSLSDEQKKNILAGITAVTNDTVLDFWVNLAKGETQDAIDIAKQLGNTEYLLYGYMKYKDSVEHDTELTGDEREALLKEINSKIKEYTPKESDKKE